MAKFGAEVTRDQAGRKWEDPYIPRDSSIRPKVVKEILQYFESNQWKKLVNLVLEPGVIHIHNYMDTNLHPVTIENIFVAYMRKKGWEMPKSVSYLGTPNLGGEVWFRPRGKGSTAKFDMKFKYVPQDLSVVLRPSKSFKPNLLGWRELDSAKAMGKYKWKTFGPKEKAEVNRYFEGSYHWYKVCEMIEDVMVPHFHLRVDTCLHPMEIIAKEVQRALEKRDFEVEKITPMEWVDTRYEMQELSKIAFKLAKPNFVFDLDWIYTPDVVLSPSKAVLPPIVEFRNENFEETLCKCCKVFRGEIYPIVLSQDEYEEIVKNIK
jgi:hypothetical protein